jgi:hypothetical protein
LGQTLAMVEKEKRYKVDGRLIVDYGLVMQELNADETRHFSTDINLDKWCEIYYEWKQMRLQGVTSSK